MKASIFTAVTCALLALSACGGNEDTSSSGNGPGDADGFGGRADPPNEEAARDAAPGQLSETSPPSTPPAESADKPTPPDTDDQPRQ